MANWNDILDEINSEGSTYDIIRRKYLNGLSKITSRNTVAYYSGWLQKPNAPEVQINDNDKNGFMTAINGLDRKKGLDLILHTPGGETAATESIIDYLSKTFKDIRTIVPQLAMSGGTMIAFMGREILMGRESSLGPIDPQLNGLPAHAVLEEFAQAYQEMAADPKKAFVWQPILNKYTPTLVGECQKSIEWSVQIAEDCLKKRMLKGKRNLNVRISKIKEGFVDHAVNLSHSRHLSAEKCRKLGLAIKLIESDQPLQDAILAVHHSFIHTLTATPAVKIIENQNGKAFIQTMQTILVPGR